MHQPVLIATKNYGGGLAKKIYYKTETTSIITNGVTRLNNSLVLFSVFYASVNSSCAHSPPPGQLRGICVPCQSRGWAYMEDFIAKDQQFVADWIIR